jgi:hypothetical protein
METKLYRPFLEICKEFVKISEIAAPFLNYDGTELAINLQKSAYENHLNDLRIEIESVINYDKNKENKERLKNIMGKAELLIDYVYPKIGKY